MSLGLAVSEFYFAAIQLLRIITDWIHEAQEDLDNLVSRLRLHKGSLGVPEAEGEDAEAFNYTLDSVVAHQRSLAKPLLARIERKHVELNSLRDGV